MTEKNGKSPPEPPLTQGPTVDRRRTSNRAQRAAPKVAGAVTRDQLGNAVWEWRVDAPRRRDDDPTIDLLECLDVDGLSIEDEKDKSREPENFNPYNKPR
jgi:hypothetical protein